jgi:ABC-type multidrug transport system permease subunit
MNFSIRRLLAITRKELRHITRDFRIFFLVTLSPAFLLIILAYLFAFDLGKISLAWYDGDHTASSRAYLAFITDDGKFGVVDTPVSHAQIERDLLTGQIDLAIFVPPGFEENLLAGRRADVEAIVDGADALSASQALSNLAARTAAYGSQAESDGVALPFATRTWYNSSLKSLWSMVPGLLAIVLTLPALALTLGVSREREVGTLEALIATPVSGAEYQLGKLIAYVLSGLVSVTLAAAVAVFWFGVPFRGNFLLFFVLAVDFYLACMGVSLLIAQFVPSQQTAMMLVLLIFFVPSFFVAGLILPPNTSSLSGLVAANVLPATHFIAIARAIFLKGLGPYPLLNHALLLALIGLLSITASLLLFRKRVG